MTQLQKKRCQRNPGYIGALLRQALDERDLTIAELARLAEVTYEHMHGVVSNRQPLSIPLALKIGPILEVDPMDLLRQQLELKVCDVSKKMASRGTPPRP